MSEPSKPSLNDEASCRTGTLVGPAPAQLPKPHDPQDNPARWMFERLASYIKQFESRLDDEHEVGARLVSFGDNLTIHIEDMGYFGPDMVVFHGRNDRCEPVQLIQHTSQFRVLLVAVRKQEQRARRIGFVFEQGDKSDTPARAAAQSV